MANHYFLGVDVGSSSVRAGLFDQHGHRLAFATRPLTQFRYGDERVEQSSTEIWQYTCEVVREAVATAHIDIRQVDAIGFDATCSLVAIDETGNGLAVSPEGDCYRNVIMWMDHRAVAETQRINATGDRALKYVGGEVSIEMALPKVLWLKEHLPQTWADSYRFFDLADFLVWKATGEDIASLCSLTCKWNYLAHEQRFSDTLLTASNLQDLPEKIPTRILAPGTQAGTLTPYAAQALGLSPHTAVASGMIDAHAGGVALAGAQPQGTLALISGTSNCHMICSKQELMTPGVWGPYWSAMLPGYWLTEGGQSAAGSLVEWTLQELGANTGLDTQAQNRGCHPVELVNEWVAELEADEEEPTHDLHILADHHGNRSPRARPDAKGSVNGLTLERGKTRLARLYLATLQAIAYGTRHILDVMRDNGHTIHRLVLCGGATHNPVWLREYADATGCDVHLLQEEDAVTLGAAITGAVACGAFSDIASACQSMVSPGETIMANPHRRQFHERKYQIYLKMWQHQQELNQLMHKDNRG